MSGAPARRPPVPRQEAAAGVPAARPAASRGRSAEPAANVRGDSVASAGRHVMTAVTAVGSPFAVGTALLFYFGWVRTHVQAWTLGYDAALLDYSLQDYVMRSINVLYNPILVLALTAVGVQWLHRRWLMPLVRGPRGDVWLPRLIRACTWSTVAWALLFAALAYTAPSLVGFCIAGFLTATLLSTFYARSLRDRLDDQVRRTRVPNSLLLAVLALAVFWATEQVARKVGEAYAVQIAADRNRLAAVVVYSAKNLNLSGSGVVETRLTTPDSEYLYRYDGLRLVQRAEDRYFLIGDGWSRQDRRVILIEESAGIRLEFYQRGREMAGAFRQPPRLASGETTSAVTGWR
jgi:hypothetical protein